MLGDSALIIDWRGVEAFFDVPPSTRPHFPSALQRSLSRSGHSESPLLLRWWDESNLWDAHHSWFTILSTAGASSRFGDVAGDMASRRLEATMRAKSELRRARHYRQLDIGEGSLGKGERQFSSTAPEFRDSLASPPVNVHPIREDSMSNRDPHLRSFANEDGTVILNTRLGTISTLNPTGAFIWQALKRGESLEAIAESLAQETGEQST